jgi:HD domain-containing protein
MTNPADLSAHPAPPPRLTERFFAAAALDNDVHGGARRVGTQIPYAAHLMIVSGLVLEDGGDETQAIAALLHDAVEDGGGEPMLKRICTEFGADVARIVEACSDSVEADDRRSWRERKQSQLERLRDVTDEAILRVVLADKVHNLRSIVRDYRAEGRLLWERFVNKSIDDQLWFDTALVALFEVRCPGPLVEDLRHALAELEQLAAGDAAATRRADPKTLRVPQLRSAASRLIGRRVHPLAVTGRAEETAHGRSGHTTRERS